MTVRPHLLPLPFALLLVAPLAIFGQATPAAGPATAADAADGRPPLKINTDPKPPVAPEGWKVETVLIAPQIESPSVVCALPDGRVLIGEDPLDNRGGKDPIDRIVCLHPDGKLTVWADKLYPVFGMAYLDGKVYVHQYPILSVYDDIDDKAANRKDLINQTGKPTIGGLNDHIPAQIRLGMDGYFYMAVGDRGVWGAKSNIDGSEAELPGGGLLRFRPDGTKLEVYCTGTRNHLDVSMNSEDEKFTYDNTDDGHGWWTRFTHMVDGGYYGYPWDYKAPENKNDPNNRKSAKDGAGDKPYQPYTLWRMAEYGGGSPTGAIGYTEDALPPEYRDNLFHCEWGKGKVQRFEVSRDGATYKVDRMTDFLTPGGDLRPLGIDITADGLGFWVTDWGYGGWHQKKPQVGRLIKVTWTGKDYSTPKPAWYVPAAMGKKFEATTAELIEGLKHPSRRVRMVAQRRLADRLKDPASALDTLNAVAIVIEHPKGIPHARWHAIWATVDLPDGVDRDRIGLLTNIVAFGERTPASVRRQALQFLGETAQVDAGPLSAVLEDETDASVRFAVATAFGRAARPSEFPFGAWDRNDRMVPSLTSQLAVEKDLFVRYALFTALNRVGKADGNYWPFIVTGLREESATVRENVTYALRNTYDAKLVDALVKLADDKSKPAFARSAAVLSAADLARKPKPWGGNWWGTQPVGNPRPPKVVDWEGTTTVLNAIRDLAKDADPAVRAAAVKAMTIAPDAGNAELLADLYGKTDDADTKQLILQALAPTKSPKAAALATAVLKDAKSPPALIPDAIAVVREAGGKDAIGVLVSLVETADAVDVIEPAMDTLGDLKATAAVPAIARRLSSDEPRIWNGAINALRNIADKPATDALIAALADPRGDIRKNAATALGLMKATNAVPALVEAVQKKRIGGEGGQALSRMPDIRAIDIYLAALADKNRGNARDARAAIEKIRGDALPIVEQRLAEGKIKPEAIAVLQEIFSSYKPITTWSYIGPFAPGAKLVFDPATMVYAKDAIRTADGATMTGLLKSTTAAADGMVDLGKLTPASGDADTYLFATLDSTAEREAMVQIGSDDTHRVWINGVQIDDDESNSGWRANESTVKVQLRKGINLIVVRAGNKGGGWQFSLAVSAERTGKLFDAPTAAPGKAKTPEAFVAFATKNAGDAARGKAVFNGQAASCIKCHQVSPTEGGLVGPSLIGVGAKYDRAKLIESVIYPSKQIFDGFQQTILRTKDDDVIAGIVKRETDSEIELFDSSAAKIVVKKADVKTRKVSELSAMPEGLEQAMTPQEFADVIAYLASLKEAAPVSSQN